MAKPQLMIIHGGTTFKNRDDYLEYLRNKDVSIKNKCKWYNDYLDKELGDKFQIIRPRMPLKENANYEDWKIYFERFIPYLKDNLILIGISLGGIFLAKYLSENELPKDVLSVYLVGPPFDDESIREDLVGGFELGEDLSKINENCNKITLMFSEDDEVVPTPQNPLKYREKLEQANIIVYDDKKGHFRISTFPELAYKINEDLKKIQSS